MSPSPFRFLLVTMLTALIFVEIRTLQRPKRSTPPTAIHPDRVDLFKEALDWMTFRKNGTLMNATDVESLFLEPLKEHYRKSKVYRTFVIAFKEGIIPRLTLKLRETCDPSYISMYKDPSNSSVTWYYLKNFTFEMYDTRRTNNLTLCDFREGLVCSRIHRYCLCPQGSYTFTVAPGSSVRRCLLFENQSCSILDIDHGNNDPRHSVLAKNLPNMIFNLEKPLSCIDGTKCSFIEQNKNTPKCYRNGNRYQWYPPNNGTIVPSWKLPFGEECALDLYADSGTCEVSDGTYGKLPGFVCYNFGPPHSLAHRWLANRTGFCAHEYGQYGLAKIAIWSNRQLQLHPFIMAFVHPRTVPLRGNDLVQYYQRFQDIVYPAFFIDGLQEGVEDQRCNFNKTEELKEIWDYFNRISFPPYRSDFSVESTPKLLEDNLQALINMTENMELKVCKVYRHYHRSYPGADPVVWPALRCVNDSMDADGNDGTCKVFHGWDNQSIPFADKLQRFLDSTSLAIIELSEENENVREDLLRANPEIECIPQQSGNTTRYRIADPLESGECQDGFVCSEDYSDVHSLYDSSCNFLTGSVNFTLTCHDEISNDLEYGECEGQQLDERISQELELRILVSSSLGMGDNCRHDVEWELRNWYRFGREHLNKYRLLALLERVKVASGGGGGVQVGPFCNASMLLECKKKNLCGCVTDTAPRIVAIGGLKYVSDYCYLTSGSCSGRDITEFGPVAEEEKDPMWTHYGEPLDDLCEMGNVCMYVDEKRRHCTKVPPGSGKKSTQGGNEIVKFVAAKAVSRSGSSFVEIMWIFTFNLFVY